MSPGQLCLSPHSITAAWHRSMGWRPIWEPSLQVSQPLQDPTSLPILTEFRAHWQVRPPKCCHVCFVALLLVFAWANGWRAAISISLCSRHRPSRLICRCYCVSLQPTCLVGQEEPQSILLSELHHFSTRISVTLKLCRRLLSGQYGSDVVVGGFLLSFMAPQVKAGGWGWLCEFTACVVTSH